MAASNKADGVEDTLRVIPTLIADRPNPEGPAFDSQRVRGRGGPGGEQPEAEAVAKLWDAIFACTRADLPDPVKAWEEHSANLARRTADADGRQSF